MEAATAVALGTTGDNSTAGAQKIGHATQQHDVLELDAAHPCCLSTAHLLSQPTNPPVLYSFSSTQGIERRVTSPAVTLECELTAGVCRPIFWRSALHICHRVSCCTQVQLQSFL
jgi:hypothetical protein